MWAQGVLVERNIAQLKRKLAALATGTRKLFLVSSVPFTLGISIPPFPLQSALDFPLPGSPVLPPSPTNV